MATKSDPTVPKPPDKVYKIGEHCDLTISVKSNEKKPELRKDVKFKVDSEALKCYSEYFKASLRFNNKFGHEVVLQDDDPAAIRVWLIYIHAAMEHNESVDNKSQENADDADDDPGLNKIPEQKQELLFKMPGIIETKIQRIWNIINAGDKYLFDGALLSGFFQRWYHRNVDLSGSRADLDFVRQLALPCYMFDYAEGFSAVTKWLVYNCVGHITENRPPGFKWKHMHLCPPDFVREYFASRNVHSLGIHDVDSSNRTTQSRARLVEDHTSPRYLGASRSASREWRSDVPMWKMGLSLWSILR